MRLIDADQLQKELMDNIHTESTRILIRAIIAEQETVETAADMTLDTYQELAARTINTELSLPETIEHAYLTVGTEASEILDIFKKRLQGHPVDYRHVLSEAGDVLWGLAELATALGERLSDVALHNIEKLRKRYPDGFDPERSMHRAPGDI